MINIIVLPGGQLQVFVDGDITFADASAKTLQLLAYLQERGIPIVLAGQPEQHKAGGMDHVHITEVQHEQH